MKKHGFFVFVVLFITGMISIPLSSHAVTLNECIMAALEESPDLQSAEARVEAAHQMLNQAKSAYYPWIDVSANYAKSDNPAQAFMMQINQRTLNMMSPDFDPNNPDATDNVRGSVTLKWRLFDSGVRASDKNMAKFGAEAAAEALAITQNQLIYEVTRGFYGVLQAQAFASVQQESVESIEESLRVATERFNAGSAVKVDVLNLETQLAAAREDLIKAQNGAQLALAALNTAIGKDLVSADNIQKPADPTDKPPPAEKDLDAAENRPEFKAAKLMTRIKKQALSKTKRAYGPSISAFASSDWDSESTSDFEQSYMAGVVAELNIFDGFRSHSAHSGALAEYESAKADEQKARNNLRLDLTQAFLKTHETWERLDVTQKSLESAEEALRITREQYEQGAADITILLTAQVGLTAMQTRNVAAQYDYLIALSNLRRAKGDLAREYVEESQ